MIDTDHNPLLHGGGWPIEVEPPQDKRDRSQAVYYRLRGRTAARRRRERLTSSERFAMQNSLWVAEQPSDHVNDLRLPPHQRPGLVRAVQLYLCWGGLLVDRLDDFGEELTQAAIVSRWHRLDRQVVANGVPVTVEKLGTLIARAGGIAAVEEAAVPLYRAAMRGLMSYVEDDDRDDLPFVVGSGDPRNYQAACDYAECLHLYGLGRREILERLNLEGWINEKDRRRWNNHNYPVRSR